VIIITRLIQLVYISTPFGYDDTTLTGILLDARRYNSRDGVTGALVCRHDLFLQLLEGPARTVEATYDRIRRDDRHVDARRLVRRRVSDRMFGDWAMLHDPVRSWIWSKEDIAGGRVDRASEAEIVGLFEDLSANVRRAPDAWRM
jgi:hypothetical protein